MLAGRIRKRLTGEEHQGPIQMARRKTPKKLKIIFVDEVNDMQSRSLSISFGRSTAICTRPSAPGPRRITSTELISVIPGRVRYEEAEVQGFRLPCLPKKPDYIVFLEESTYDLLKDVMPWDAKRS